MKTFKRTDLIVQSILIVVFAVILLVRQNTSVLITYLAVVGGWQLVSLVVHFINKWHPYKGGRRFNFELVLAGFALVTCLMPFIEPLRRLVYLFLILLLLMPLYYLWVCFMEVFYYSKRPLELI